MGIFLLTKDFKILLILFHSKLSLIGFDPGRVDSPPTSIKLAPQFFRLIAWSTPFSMLLNFPPSEKLSGVKFKTPNIFGFFLKFKLEKFFFFDWILFKSKYIFFFSNFGRSLI